MSSTTKTQYGWWQKVVFEIIEYWIAFLYLALLLGSIYLVRWWTVGGLPWEVFRRSAE